MPEVATWTLCDAMVGGRRGHPLEIWRDFENRPVGPDVAVVRHRFASDSGGVLRDHSPPTLFAIGPPLEPLADAGQMDLFLGAGKYDPILEHVYRGLGIPAHLLKPEAAPCPPISTGS